MEDIEAIGTAFGNLPRLVAVGANPFDIQYVFAGDTAPPADRARGSLAVSAAGTEEARCRGAVRDQVERVAQDAAVGTVQLIKAHARPA